LLILADCAFRLVDAAVYGIKAVILRGDARESEKWDENNEFMEKKFHFDSIFI
jgi:hypothetical protein